MTYHRDDDIQAGDRPALEIEITPAMIDAGHAQFCSFDSRFEDISDAVARIFRAMASEWRDR